MTNTVDIQTASKLLGINAGHLRRQCIAGKYKGATRTGHGWQIPVSADSRLSGVKTPGQLSLEVDLTDVPKHKREEAIRRRGIIEQAEQFCGHAVRNNICRLTALEQYSNEIDIPLRTLQRWIANYKQRGIAGLIDSRGGQSFGDIITPEAWNEFQSKYLTQQRLSIKACLNHILYIAKSEKKNWTIPSLRTLQQYVEKNIPVPVAVLRRQGPAAYEAQCAPYIMVDQNSVQPGAVWVGDHHQFDCFIRHRGEWVRPWITGWEDYRSRKIVGWYISTNPNSSTILRAMKRGIEEYGPPDAVKIDNGKDYDSKTFTGQTKQQRRKAILSDCECQIIMGLYASMDIKTSFAIPYHPQSKKIERWFATVCQQFTKTVPTYCGRNTLERDDKVFDYMKTDKAVAEAYNLETFAQTIGQYIQLYNASAHTGDGMNGRSPDQVFATRTSRRVIDVDLIDTLSQKWDKRKVGKNGVMVNNLWFGQADINLHMYFGKDVLLSYDPDRINLVNVYEETTQKFITAVQRADLVPYGDISEEDMREAMAKKKRCIRAVRQAVPAARVAARSNTDQLLASMAENILPSTPEQITSIRPVKTPLDGQAKEILRQRNRLQLRKAAGAEGMTSAPTLDFEPAQARSVSDGISLDFSDTDSKPKRQGIRLSYD